MLYACAILTARSEISAFLFTVQFGYSIGGRVASQFRKFLVTPQTRCLGISPEELQSEGSEGLLGWNFVSRWFMIQFSAGSVCFYVWVKRFSACFAETLFLRITSWRSQGLPIMLKCYRVCASFGGKHIYCKVSTCATISYHVDVINIISELKCVEIAAAQLTAPWFQNTVSWICLDPPNNFLLPWQLMFHGVLTSMFVPEAWKSVDTFFRVCRYVPMQCLPPHFCGRSNRLFWSSSQVLAVFVRSMDVWAY